MNLTMVQSKTQPWFKKKTKKPPSVVGGSVLSSNLGMVSPGCDRLGGYDFVMRKKNLVCVVFAVLSGPLFGQGFDLKGYRLGDPMTECPSGARKVSPDGVRQNNDNL